RSGRWRSGTTVAPCTTRSTTTTASAASCTASRWRATSRADPREQHGWDGERPSCRNCTNGSWPGHSLAEAFKDLLGGERNERPGDLCRDVDKANARADDGAGVFAVTSDHRPGGRFAEIGIRELPDCSSLPGGLAESERFMMAAEARQTSIEV